MGFKTRLKPRWEKREIKIRFRDLGEEVGTASRRRKRKHGNLDVKGKAMIK